MTAPRFFASLICLAASLAAPAALADDMTAPESVPDITGAWTFETGPYNSSCVIRGRMFIQPADTNGVRSCEFVTFENCPGISAEVRQTCTARQFEDRLEIDSEIAAIEWQEPASYGYAPDNWHLIIRSSEEMSGTLESASRARATFRRESIPLS